MGRGVLAPDQDGDEALAPQPGLARLGTLVDPVADLYGQGGDIVLANSLKLRRL